MYFSRRFPNLFIFGVFDGHGLLGENASLICAQMLPPRVGMYVGSGMTVADAVVRAFHAFFLIALSVGF